MLRVAKLLVLHGACNVFGILYGIGYMRLAVAPELSLEQAALFSMWIAGCVVVTFVPASAVLLAVDWPVLRALQARGRGEPVAPDAIRRAVGLPIIHSRISTFAWIAPALSLPIYAWATGGEVEPVWVLHGVVSTMLVGTVASTFVFYAVEAVVRIDILPALAPEGKLSVIAGISPANLRMKLLVLLGLICVEPVGVLSFAAWSGTASPKVVIYLAVSFVVFGALQAWAIAMSINRPLRRLVDQMKKVERNDLTARAPVVSTDEVGRLSEGFNSMVEGLRRGEFVKETFGRYVTHQVLDEILGGNISLGGELRTATVMFCDIRGFTALSERLRPEAIVSFLNEYLDIMVNVIVDHGGTIDKFIGDAIMATFGVPLAGSDDARRAARAAVDMARRLEGFNAERTARGDAPIRIGIGLHTGPVVAGNIGSSKKMEYTVIGDTVNTASRIESLTKELGVQILISEQTWRQLGGEFTGRELAPVEVRGKQYKIIVYELLAHGQLETPSAG